MNLFGVSGVLIGITSVSLAALVFIHNPRNLLNRLWALFALSVAVWGFGGYLVSRAQVVEDAFFWWRITHIGIIMIPILFTRFVYIFLELRRQTLVWITYTLGIFFLLADATPYFISHMRYVFNQFYYDSPPGPLYTPFVIFFFTTVAYAHYLLYTEYQRVSKIKQQQIKYFFLATAVGFSGGSTSFLPVFGIDLYPVLNFTVVLYPIIMAYAILKHQLFNIKVAATELLVGAIAVFLSVQLFTGETVLGNIWNASLLIGFLIFGYFLVKSVIKEIEQRERLEKLAGELSVTNEELQRLDEAKSEFISIASHQLRSPLTVVKGYLSLLMEGIAGQVEGAGAQALRRMSASGEQLGRVIDELLDLARMESGRLKYNLEQDGFVLLIQEVISGLHQSTEKKNVKVEFNNSLKSEDHLKFDRQKMKETIAHLIENAIKYSYQGGKVAVTLEETPNAAKKQIRLSIKDQGIGLSAEIKPYLFTKFSRAEEARRIDPDGFGIGLYFVKKVIEDHGGKVWAESEGEGKGSVFWVELPIR